MSYPHACNNVRLRKAILFSAISNSKIHIYAMVVILDLKSIFKEHFDYTHITDSLTDSGFSTQLLVDYWADVRHAGQKRARCRTVSYGFALCLYLWASFGVNVVDQQCSWARSGPHALVLHTLQKVGQI